MEELNSRHPYTYSCDYIRGLAGYNRHGTKISRSDASEIRKGIAKALRMEDRDLAIVLSYMEQSKTDSEIKKQAQKAMNALGF